MNDLIKVCLVVVCFVLFLLVQGVEILIIVMVNNNDMICMQCLFKVFEESYLDIVLKWVVFEENVLCQCLIIDIVIQGGQFDLFIIGMYEVVFWGVKGWLELMSGLFVDYVLDDLLFLVCDGFFVKGMLYVLLFYVEVLIIYYCKDLFQQVGLWMFE